MWSSALLLFIQLVIFNNLFSYFTFCQPTLLLGCHSLSFFHFFNFSSQVYIASSESFLIFLVMSSFLHIHFCIHSFFTCSLWTCSVKTFNISSSHISILSVCCCLPFEGPCSQLYCNEGLFWLLFAIHRHMKMMMISGLARPVDPADEGRRSLQAQRVSLSHCQHNRHAFWATT